jgi:hypothetical protein
MSTEIRSSGATSTARTVVGLLLVVPAVAGLIGGYVAPTLDTVSGSVVDRSPLGSGPGSPGLEAYGEVGGDAATAILTATAWAVVPGVALLVVAPALALAAHLGGRTGRWLARLLLALPAAALAPFAVALGWSLSRLAAGEPDATSVGRLLVVWATTAGLACAAGVTAYLAVLRGARTVPGAWAGAVVVAAVLTAAAVALAIQDGAYALALGSTAETGAVPSELVLRLGFAFLDFRAAAVVGTVLLIVLGTLGLAVTALLVLTGARLEVLDDREPGDAIGAAGPTARTVGVVVTAAGGSLVLVLAGAALWPWLSRSAATGVPDGVSALQVAADTWLPPLLTATVSVGLAAVAAFGVGALRPLGQWSESLLLIFAPWLFVGTVPLVVARFETLQELGLVGESLSLVPQAWVAIPGLVVLTLLFRGQELRRHRLRGPGEPPRPMGRAVVLPALPMVAAVWVVTWVVLVQDPVWSYVTAVGDDLTAHILVLRQIRMTAGTDVSLGLVMPAGLLAVLVLAVAAFQILHLDRLALRLGRR